MIERFTLSDPKPSFKDGQFVIVDMGVLGGTGYLTGKVVGKGSENVIDFWLVEFDKDFGPSYPFHVTNVIHTAFVKSMPIAEFVKVLEQNDGVKRNLTEMSANLREYLKQ